MSTATASNSRVDAAGTSPHDDAYSHLTALFAPGDYATIRPTETWTANGKKVAKVDYEGAWSLLLGCKNGDGQWHATPDNLRRNIACILRRTEAQHTNLFLGVCPRVGGSGRYEQAWQIRTVRAVWADVDNTDDEAVLLGRCKKAGLPEPSIIVFSGHGLHLYWLLDTPCLINDVGNPPPVETEWTEKNGKRRPRKYIRGDGGEKLYLDIPSNRPELSAKAQYITDIVQGVAVSIGGDHTFDLSRLLAVAGSLNRKNQRNGQEPILRRLLKCEPEQRYSIETFTKFADQSPAKVERERIAKVKLPRPRKMTPRREDKVDDLVLVCDTAPVGERSEADFALCCWAVEQGVDKQELWSRIQSIGKFVEGGERYFVATWEKAAGHTREKLWAKAQKKHTRKQTCQATKGNPRKPDSGDEHVIVIGTDETRVIDEAIAAVASLDRIYQRAGALVHVVTNATPPPGISRSKDAPRIVPLPAPRLREYLADAATWLSPGGEGEGGPTHPPDWAVKAVVARGEWANIPPIEGVIESPVIRADGSVVQTPGYDPASGLFYRPMIAFPPIPPKPTQDDARRAADALLEVVEDFPFGSRFHRGGWLSGVLTPMARFAFHGPTPLHLIDSNTRGTGKGLSADTIGVIVQGRSMPRMTAPSTDDEFRKRITAIALAAEQSILVDNIEGSLGCPALDAALTSTSWSDRILGQSTMASNIPLTAVWFATGNNVVLLGDTARRTLHIRLESLEERPEERTDFRHVNLLKWVQTERPRLVAAAVTILAGYCKAGRPSMGLKPWGSFDAWSDLVRSAITWAGVDDPGETRTELNSTADTEANTLRRLIEGWAQIDTEGRGMTVASVVDAIAWHDRQATTLPADYQTVRDAICELVPAKGNLLPSARSVGMRFKKFRHRVIGGRYLDVRNDHNGNFWYVREAGENG